MTELFFGPFFSYNDKYTNLKKTKHDFALLYLTTKRKIVDKKSCMCFFCCCCYGDCLVIFVPRLSSPMNAVARVIKRSPRPLLFTPNFDSSPSFSPADHLERAPTRLPVNTTAHVSHSNLWSLLTSVVVLRGGKKKKTPPCEAASHAPAKTWHSIFFLFCYPHFVSAPLWVCHVFVFSFRCSHHHPHTHHCHHLHLHHHLLLLLPPPRSQSRYSIALMLLACGWCSAHAVCSEGNVAVSVVQTIKSKMPA